LLAAACVMEGPAEAPPELSLAFGIESGVGTAKKPAEEVRVCHGSCKPLRYRTQLLHPGTRERICDGTDKIGVHGL
jgi:hypothetical protein